jgi:hypothetical protein
MGLIQLNLWSQNLLLKASADGWLVKIVDFGLSNTHEVDAYSTYTCCLSKVCMCCGYYRILLCFVCVCVCREISCCQLRAGRPAMPLPRWSRARNITARSQTSGAHSTASSLLKHGRFLHYINIEYSCSFITTTTCGTGAGTTSLHVYFH